MPKIVQHRRGTTAQVSGITGAAGELFVDTSKVTLVVMDGILQGGVALATETSVTVVSSALSTLSSNLNTLSSNVNTLLNTATTLVLGIVRPDGTSILVTSGVISANISIGDSSTAGILRPDGTSILVTSGVISIATINEATTAIAGIVRPNNSSILVTSGVISVNNNLTLTSFTDSKGEVRNAPQNSRTSAYTLVAADAGKHISITTGGVTIASAVFSTGDMVTIFNNSAASQTITQGASTTVYLAGTASTGNRTLAQRGLCTIICVAANTFAIAGSGLT